jgi:hypothetical protein
MNLKYILLFASIIMAGVLMPILPQYVLLLMMILTVSIGLLTVKKGYKISFISLIIAVGASYVIRFSAVTAILCFAAAISGIFLGIGLLKEYSLQYVIAIGTGSFLISILIFILCVSIITDKNILSTYLDAHFSALKNYYELQLQSPIALELPDNIPFSEFKENLFALIDNIEHMVRAILPYIFITSISFLTYFNLGIIRIILAKTGMRFAHLPTFDYLRMGRNSGWIMILAWILPQLTENRLIILAFLNIYFIMASLLSFCAISFIVFILRQKIEKTWLRVLTIIGGIFALLALVLKLPYLLNIITIILVMIGIADSNMDLRRTYFYKR